MVTFFLVRLFFMRASTFNFLKLDFLEIYKRNKDYLDKTIILQPLMEISVLYYVTNSTLIYMEINDVN